MEHQISISREVKNLVHNNSAALIKKAVNMALNAEGVDVPCLVSVMLTDDEGIRRVNRELSFGGGCINDVVIHLATSNMGFGGVGKSGMGSYHGEAGFRAFSHEKSMVDKKTWLDLPMRYQPYQGKLYETLLHLFLR